MNPRPQATGAKPLSKKELRASLDRVVEERDALREELESAADTLCDIVTREPDWTAFQSTIDAELKRMHESLRAALRSGEGGTT